MTIKAANLTLMVCNMAQMKFLIPWLVLVLTVTNCKVGSVHGSSEVDIKGQVFILTDDVFDQKTCELRATDFGFSELLFLNKKEFGLVVNYGTTSYYKGTYVSTKDKIILTFKALAVDRVVEEGTSKEKFDTHSESISKTEFAVGRCQGKVMLENTTRPGFRFGIRIPVADEKAKMEALRNSKGWKLLSN